MKPVEPLLDERAYNGVNDRVESLIHDSVDYKVGLFEARIVDTVWTIRNRIWQTIRARDPRWSPVDIRP